jgi:hypothetical protein
MGTTKLAIAINLDQLRDLMREFINHVTLTDDLEVDTDDHVDMEWTFEMFLQWLKKRQEMTNEHSQRTTNLRVVTPAKRRGNGVVGNIARAKC